MSSEKLTFVTPFLQATKLIEKCYDQKTMRYLEPLPEGCPPDEADEITTERLVFRLVRTHPATLDDFRSQRAEKPDAVFKGITECQARGLSVHTERRDCTKLLKLPRLRTMIVATLRLVAPAGRLQKTFQPSHHTWWPLADFDILAHCEMDAA